MGVLRGVPRSPEVVFYYVGVGRACGLFVAKDLPDRAAPIDPIQPLDDFCLVLPGWSWCSLCRGWVLFNPSSVLHRFGDVVQLDVEPYPVGIRGRLAQDFLQVRIVLC